MELKYKYALSFIFEINFEIKTKKKVIYKISLM